MVFEEGSSKLYFKVLHQKQFLNDIKNKSATMKNALDNKRVVGEKKYTTLEFDDVTAADLKVTSKFGSWDTMATRLLVENKTPLVTWQKVRAGSVSLFFTSMTRPSALWVLIVKISEIRNTGWIINKRA